MDDLYSGTDGYEALSDKDNSMEVMLEERREMESQQELSRVKQMNKVTGTIHNPMATKLARNLLSKISTGPLTSDKCTLTKASPTSRDDEGSLDASHTSDELRFEQRRAHIQAMKESQNEELDTLRRKKIVQTKLADRRMKSRAKRMFNHRVYVKPSREKSTKKKGGILVTGVEQVEEDNNTDFFRQESHMYIDNFFKNPSHNRRVLQRLNSEQIRGITSSLGNMKGHERFEFDKIPEVPSNAVFDGIEKDGICSKPKVDEVQSSKSAQGSPTIRKRGSSDRPSSPSKLSKLGRKIKGGIKKAKRHKTRKTRHASSSLDEVIDDVRLKPRKKSLEKKKWYSKSSKRKTFDEKHSKEEQAQSPPSSLPPSNQQPSSKLTCLQSPPGLQPNWPPLPASSVAPPTASIGPWFKGLSVEGATVSGGPPPLYTEEKKSTSVFQTSQKSSGTTLKFSEASNELFSNEGSHMTNGVSSPVSHDNHMTEGLTDDTPTPLSPVTTLREIEQNSEDGYMSESESGTYSEEDISQLSSYTQGGHNNWKQLSRGKRISADGACSDDEGDDMESPEPLETQNGHFDIQGDEIEEKISDLPTPTKSKRLSHKTSSQDSNKSIDDHSSQHSSNPHYKRYFSSPQLSFQFSSGSEVTHPVCSLNHATPHGYYNTAVVEVNPFSIEFEQGAQENLAESLNRDQLTVTSWERQEVMSHSRQASEEFIDFDRSQGAFVPTLETIESRTHTQFSYSRQTSGVRQVPGRTYSKTADEIPPHAFRDPKFREFIETLDHKPKMADYISYQLRTIGDQIDLKYDEKLNQALDAIFMEAVKSNLSWESFSAISKRLLLEGQRIQDGIFMIPCFGRRLTEMVPQLGDRVNGFTQRVMEKYASDLILGIGGWGRLVESYNQVETSEQSYEFDYEEYADHGYVYGQDWNTSEFYGHTSSHIPQVKTVSPSRQRQNRQFGANSFDDPLPGHSLPNVIQVNPPQTCLHSPSANFDPYPNPNRLRRVISVEVLFTEQDNSTEHAQNGYHDDMPYYHSFRKSLSASSLDITSPRVQNGYTHKRSPSPTKQVSEFIHIHETHTEEVSYHSYGRRGSVTSVCSTGSTIRLVTVPNGEHHGAITIVPKGGAIQNGPGIDYLDLPRTVSGEYLDLHFDTPTPSRSNTRNCHDNRRDKKPENESNRGENNNRLRSIAVPIATVAIVIGVVSLGIWYLRKK